VHPAEGLPIFLLTGPFGPYVQLGEVTDETPKPKRVSVPKNMEPGTIDLETAVSLLSLPRNLGPHPESGKAVNAGIGRFGPYVVHDGKYKSLGKDQDVLTVELTAAIELLKQARGRGGATPLRELGPHPEDGAAVAIYEGRYGPYVKHGKLNATIPKDHDPLQVSLTEAIRWLAERAAKKGVKRGGASATRKKAIAPVSASAKKSGAPKGAAKKSVAKKSTTKKVAKKQAAKKVKPRK
jgi:DNA topoisomerase-1